mgnify:CR=1 FL=1
MPHHGMGDTAPIQPRLVPVIHRGVVIPGYLVDDCGVIYSLWAKASGGRIRWGIGTEPIPLRPYPITRSKAYLGVALRCNGRTNRASVHALVMQSFCGPCPDGLEICHEDGNGRNNSLANLRYGTRESNEADKLRHGTHQNGERNPSAKLSNAEADEVRRLRASGMKLREIAAIYHIAESAVSRIANGKRRAR